MLGGAVCAQAQSTIFQENWDGQGPGITGWTLYNVDGNTPVPATTPGGGALSALVTDAWNVLSLTQVQTALNSTTYTYPTAATGMAGNVAASNSWYTPAGTSNDWLVSPQINIPAGATGVSLKWAATSLGDIAFLENYKVYISTTGNQVANFTTTLLNVTGEPNTGSYRTVDLSAYAGQSVYIAFRNDSQDMFVMFLDNISITAGSLSTSEIRANDSSVTIYPNPATDVLQVKSKDQIKSITVFDSSGRKVNVNASEHTVYVKSLTPGTYLINIETDKTTITEKFIKK